MAAGTDRTARALASLSLLALLAACAAQPIHPGAGTAPAASALSAVQQAEAYREKARPRYAAPGTPEDPWGPYVHEASKRFDVPETWIREVMHVESNGTLIRSNGTLTTSPVGAMGLMQVMPATYGELKDRYRLGDDPYEPHDNIMAGTAYLREMYDAFGTPAFLAAYNAGPARLEDYLTRNRPLPDETRRYVAMIGSRIGGVYPESRSPAEQLAVNQIPVNIPPGPRWGRVLLARAKGGRHATVRYAAAVPAKRPAIVLAKAAPAPRVVARPAITGAPVEVAEAPEPRAATAPRHGGLHIITPALAAENVKLGGRDWAVQLGAFGSSRQAAQAASGAAQGRGTPAVGSVKSGRATLYRARLTGMTHEAAVATCQKVRNCIILSPASQ